MYRLTPRMLQRFYQDLRKYHGLFSGGRCQGWEQEELIVNAIKSDTTANHHVVWTEGGHDSKEDIRVKTNGSTHIVQIKSGKIKANARLELSGYRMGTYKDDWIAITDYLKSKDANILSVAYKKIDNAQGRQHIYQVSYVEADLLKDLSPTQWEKRGSSYKQISSKGVEFSVHPSMSWQIWWKIPIKFAEQEKPFVIQ